MRNLPSISSDRTLVRHENIGSDYLQLQPRDPSLRNDGIRVYLNILKRRKWYIIIPFFVITPIMMLNLALENSVFKTTTRILIEDNTLKILDIQDMTRQDRSENFFLTEYQMIKNEENIGEVVDILRLDQRVPDEKHGLEKWIDEVTQAPKRLMRTLKQRITAFIMPPVENGNQGTPNIAELRRQEAIGRFAQAVQVGPRDGGKLVDITISGSAPNEVAQQANMLAEIYIRKNLEKKLEAATNASSWLQKQTIDLKQQLHDAELRLQNFREKENFVSLDAEEKDNIVLARLNMLHAEHNTARAERIDLETRLNSIQRLAQSDIRSMEKIPPFIESYLINSIRELRSRYLALEIQRVELSEKYKEKHPAISTIDSQIEETNQAIDREFQKSIDSLRGEYSILRAKEASLEEELNDQKSATLGLNKDMISYNTLKRDAESYRNLYNEALERLRELKLTQASVANNVKVVKKASVPLEPDPSQATMMMVLSIILSCSLGVGLAFIREYFDSRFKEGDEVEPYLQIQFLGIIPHFANGKRKAYAPVLLHDPASLTAEAYRILRTRLQAAAPMPKTLIVTSAVPSEGKSTTSANLGLAFAQLGWNVLLVDADLRRPTLHRHFGISNTAGLATILTDGVDWQQVMQATPLVNLKLLPAGFSTRNSSDLLNLGAMKELVAVFKSSFDLVIFDAPLVFSIPDVEVIAPDMDGVLLVHAPDKCDKESVVRAKHVLERAESKIIGIVFNNIRKKVEKSYYNQYRYSTYNLNSNSNNDRNVIDKAE